MEYLFANIFFFLCVVRASGVFLQMFLIVLSVFLIFNNFIYYVPEFLLFVFPLLQLQYQTPYTAVAVAYICVSYPAFQWYFVHIREYMNEYVNHDDDEIDLIL